METSGTPWYDGEWFGRAADLFIGCLVVLGVAIAAVALTVCAWVIASDLYRRAFPPHPIARRDLGSVVGVDIDRRFVAIRTERGTVILDGAQFVPRGRASFEFMSDAGTHVVIDGQRFFYREGFPLWPWDHTPPADFDRVTR